LLSLIHKNETIKMDVSKKLLNLKKINTINLTVSPPESSKETKLKVVFISANNERHTQILL